MENIEDILNYKFKDKSLLSQAFVHSSYANEHNISSYERLEFLGDSVLNIVTTNYLFKKFEINEGDLSKMRAQIVSAENLSHFIDDNNLIDNLQTTNISTKASTKVKGDLYESILGAIYLDGGYYASQKFVFKSLDFKHTQFETLFKKDYKTVLQEIVQEKNKTKVKYHLVEKSGPAHKPQFKINLLVDGKIVASAVASSKKIAENMSAKQAIDLFKENKL